MMKLAIIIPAYKSDFLQFALNSFVNQTNKNFTIYIGDDKSPNKILEIVDLFRDKLDIKYFKFDNNLGAQSLTKQWQRCIDLSSEEWIWLFSDDDIVDENAVQVFFDSVNSKESLLYKFKTKVIDEAGQLNKYFQKFDKFNLNFSYLTSNEFIINRLKCNGFRSFAVEYIFHRSLFEDFKFIEFPLAWASDDATWLLYSLNNNRSITVLNATVYWRYSNVNISSNHTSPKIIGSKVSAAVAYLVWLKQIDKEYTLNLKEKDLNNWLMMQLLSLNYIFTLRDIKRILKSVGFGNNFINLMKYYFVLNFYNLYKKMKNV